ncbi:MAG: DUF2510 domain-containing protein, partial [Candidatus Nanopelagicaceae bacterium]
MEKAPAGWYPDPEDGTLRYFDGEKWLDIPAPSNVKKTLKPAETSSLSSPSKQSNS